MKGLLCQLKSVLRDKFCLMTFLLPVVVAAAFHFVGAIDFSALGEFHFGILEGDLPADTVQWLEQYGPVTACQTSEELKNAILDPSTNLIGVKADGGGIQTILAGDELDLFRQTAQTLPELCKQRHRARQIRIRILKRPDVMAGYQDMFSAVTLIVAMFMGCTFNAMNMISEKEDGVALVNEILPMSHSQYIVQKLTVGLVCGCLSAILTACLCFRLSVKDAALMLVLIVLSAFVAALIGLFIGRASSGLMAGVVYIKIVMLLFIAVPILSFLLDITQPLLAAAFYLVPSQAAFKGVMNLAAGSKTEAVKNIFILLAQCVGWFLFYIGISARQGKNA